MSRLRSAAAASLNKHVFGSTVPQWYARIVVTIMTSARAFLFVCLSISLLSVTSTSLHFESLARALSLSLSSPLHICFLSCLARSTLPSSLIHSPLPRSHYALALTPPYPSLSAALPTRLPWQTAADRCWRSSCRASPIRAMLLSCPRRATTLSSLVCCREGKGEQMNYLEQLCGISGQYPA